MIAAFSELILDAIDGYESGGTRRRTTLILCDFAPTMMARKLAIVALPLMPYPRSFVPPRTNSTFGL
jgi:hypothetical protein